MLFEKLFTLIGFSNILFSIKVDDDSSMNDDLIENRKCNEKTLSNRYPIYMPTLQNTSIKSWLLSSFK